MIRLVYLAIVASLLVPPVFAKNPDRLERTVGIEVSIDQLSASEQLKYLDSLLAQFESAASDTRSEINSVLEELSKRAAAFDHAPKAHREPGAPELKESPSAPEYWHFVRFQKAGRSALLALRKQVELGRHSMTTLKDIREMDSLLSGLYFSRNHAKDRAIGDPQAEAAVSALNTQICAYFQKVLDRTAELSAVLESLKDKLRDFIQSSTAIDPVRRLRLMISSSGSESQQWAEGQSPEERAKYLKHARKYKLAPVTEVFQFADLDLSNKLRLESTHHRDPKGRESYTIVKPSGLDPIDLSAEELSALELGPPGGTWVYPTEIEMDRDKHRLSSETGGAKVLRAYMTGPMGGPIYRDIYFEYLDEILSRPGGIATFDIVKSGLSSLDRVGEWLFTVEPGTYRIRVAPKAISHSCSALFTPLPGEEADGHANLASSGTGLSPEEVRTPAAGLLHFSKDGLLTSFDNKTGHFKIDPRVVGPLTMSILRQKNYSSLKNTRIEYHGIAYLGPSWGK